jgi:hypothetical protein
MGNWRETILKEFAPQVAKLTVVADPDALLSEEIILQEIQMRGFDLVVYEEPIPFRYLYESKLRLARITGVTKELIILLRSEEDSFVKMPYDILVGARKLRFGLDRLFPQMNRGVLVGLDRSLLDSLHQAQVIYTPQQLSENGTKDFILRHVFEIAPETIKTPADLLRNLLRKHYHEQKVPTSLDSWLIQMLRRTNRFSDWPLEKIVPERDAFLAFLQERWPAFLNSLEPNGETAAHELAASYHPVYSGPTVLPFEHDDVRVYIDNLFAEGLLKPVSHMALGNPEEAGEINHQPIPSWIKIGLLSDPEAERVARIQRMLQVIDVEFQPEAARYTDWLILAGRWAEVTALWYNMPKPKPHRVEGYEPLKSKFDALKQRIDESFPVWLQHSYGTLYNIPSLEPVMVHQIPRYMAKGLQSVESREALVIIDGMSFDQWVVIKETLQSQLKEYKFSTGGAFAWIPTLTSVSRQSIFAGKPPMFFPERIWDTKSEKSLWAQFWSDAGLSEYQIYYRLMAGEFAKLERIKDEIAEQKVRVVGLVIDKVDKIMHGMELGTAGMLNQVRQWVELGDLAKLIQLLSENRYRVLISSDHGNIEATGWGGPNEGATADLRGERARIYSDEVLRSSIKVKYPEAVEWNPIGLPENYYPLLASGRTAFVQKEKHTVCHGGISLEEVIVPFIRVEKR